MKNKIKAKAVRIYEELREKNNIPGMSSTWRDTENKNLLCLRKIHYENRYTEDLSTKKIGKFPKHFDVEVCKKNMKVWAS